MSDDGQVSRNDSGSEAQPAGEDAVERSARIAERLDRQNRPFDDEAGTNPLRRQDTGPDRRDDEAEDPD